MLVTDSNNCQVGAGTFVSSVGIRDHESFNNGIQIFPNPASGELNFYFPGSTGNGQLSIFNSLGVEVFSKTLAGEEAKKFSITQNFSAGIYSVVFRKNESVWLSKLVMAWCLEAWQEGEAGGVCGGGEAVDRRLSASSIFKSPIAER